MSKLPFITGKTILVSPLNWGLGHTTRCVPIIEELLARGKRVILAADGPSYDFLAGYFPDLELVRFPGVNISYSHSGLQMLFLLKQVPDALQATFDEHLKTQELVEKYGIDTIISDNRPGVYSNKARSFYMTHQLEMILPKRWGFLTPMSNLVHQWFMRRFDELLVPDFGLEARSLAGKLSHPKEVSVRSSGHQTWTIFKGKECRPLHYIGPLSRFSSLKFEDIEAHSSEIVPDRSEVNFTWSTDPRIDIVRPLKMVTRPREVFDVCCLISGPEPQCSLFQEACKQYAMRHSDKHVLILEGKPGEKRVRRRGNLCVINHLPDVDMAYYLRHAKLIICRSGYSTLMDLLVLERGALLVPTPGQSEQMYLAYHMTHNTKYSRFKHRFNVCMQENLGKKE